MAESPQELTRIHWLQAFPILRMFRAFEHARALPTVLLTLFAIVLIYAAGRMLDSVWLQAGGGVTMIEGRTIPNEIAAYAAGQDELRRWANLMSEADLAQFSDKQAGPFIALVKFQQRCGVAAMQAAIAGRWASGGPAAMGRPSVIDCVATWMSGFAWLITQRSWFAIVFGLVNLAILALFGGAACRAIAIQTTQRHRLEFGEAFAFAKEKFFGFFNAPLYLFGLFLAIGLCVLVGSALLGLIPIVNGLTFALAILAGIAMAMCFVVLVFGFPLMWPTIAVEGSDAFDAIQRAAGYLFAKPWHVLVLSLVGVIYGCIGFLVVRFLALLTLKSTHMFAAVGMSWFGGVSASYDEAKGALDGIWMMPSWADLPIIPAVGGVPFYGVFIHDAQLSTMETITQALIATWVFGLVSIMGALLLAYWFAASTEMYLLLRNAVDGVPFGEAFYEDDLDDTFEFGDGESEESKGTPLPIATGDAESSAAVDASAPS